MINKVELNQYGFYSLKDKPNPDELQRYYSDKYYQQAKDNYEQTYSDEEIEYFNNKIEQKYFVANKLIGNGRKTFIDIGCGEGWTLNFFKKENWTCKGLDYSSYGCEKFNPHCKDVLIAGDIYNSLNTIIQSQEKFSIVWIDNVLEHVLDPLDLLIKAKAIVESNGVIIIEVPNDFSLLQEYLLKNQYINTPYWIAIPDHISYFNKDGLINLAHTANLQPKFVMGDFPIDINLLNPLTNYNIDKTKGKQCYQAKIHLENLLHSVSIEKTNKLYESMIDIGLGRQIIAFFSPK